MDNLLPDELLFIVSVQTQALANAAQNQCDEFLEEFDKDELDYETLTTDETESSLRTLACNTAAVGAYLREGRLKRRQDRGPYNRWAKCTEYFEKALSWPDAEFRHEFR